MNRADVYVTVLLNVIIPEMIQQHKEDFATGYCRVSDEIARVMETTSSWAVSDHKVVATVVDSREGALWGSYLSDAWDRTYNALIGSPWDMPVEQGWIDKGKSESGVMVQNWASTFEW